MIRDLNASNQLIRHYTRGLDITQTLEGNWNHRSPSPQEPAETAR
ncbi:MAG: hypothetical protein AAGA45_05220 [Verrucomicrobiota bacterium]